MENKDRQAALFMAADEICDYLNINNSYIFSHLADRRDNDVCITLYNKELVAKEIEIKFHKTIATNTTPLLQMCGTTLKANTKSLMHLALLFTKA